MCDCVCVCETWHLAQPHAALMKWPKGALPLHSHSVCTAHCCVILPTVMGGGGGGGERERVSVCVFVCVYVCVCVCVCVREREREREQLLAFMILREG